jgi:hypothetical protein
MSMTKHSEKKQKSKSKKQKTKKRKNKKTKKGKASNAKAKSNKQQAKTKTGNTYCYIVTIFQSDPHVPATFFGNSIGLILNYPTLVCMQISVKRKNNIKKCSDILLIVDCHHHADS